MGNCVRLIIECFHEQEIEALKEHIGNDKSVLRWGNNAICFGREPHFPIAPCFNNYMVINGINSLRECYTRLLNLGWFGSGRRAFFQDLDGYGDEVIWKASEVYNN